MFQKFLPVLGVVMALSSPALARDHHDNDRGNHRGPPERHYQIPRNERVVVIKQRPAPIISFNWGSPYYTSRYPGGYASAYPGSYYREPVAIPVRWDYYGRPIEYVWR